LDIRTIERLTNSYIIVVSDDGRFTGLGDQHGIDNTAYLGDEREILTDIVIDLDSEHDGEWQGGCFQSYGLRTIVVVQAKVGPIQAIYDAATVREDERRHGDETNGNADGSRLLRTQE
jgi:hypothetical protein